MVDFTTALVGTLSEENPVVGGLIGDQNFPVGIPNSLPASAKSSAEKIVVPNMFAPGQTQVQAAIDNAPAGAVLFFPDGTYAASDVSVKAGLTIQGESWRNTIFRRPDGANSRSVLASRRWTNSTPNANSDSICFRNLRIDGNRTNQSGTEGSGLILCNYRPVVEQCWIEECAEDGVSQPNVLADGSAFTNDAVGAMFVRSRIEDCGRYHISAFGNSTYTDNWVIDCSLSDAKTSIYAEPASGWFVSRNHIDSIKDNMLYFESTSELSLLSNYFESYGQAPAGSAVATVVINAARAGAGIVILGNTGKNNAYVPGVAYRYLSLRAATSQAANIIVASNQYEMNPLSPNNVAIYTAAASGGTMSVMSANNFVSNLIRAWQNTGSSFLSEQGNSWNSAATVPPPVVTNGFWHTGQRIYVNNPSSETEYGICTTGGNPGTWQSVYRNSPKSGVIAPATTPSYVGQVFVDSVAKKAYVATGTTSSADWTILN